MGEIVPFSSLPAGEHEAAARILVDALAHVPSAWKSMEAARGEIATLEANAGWRGFAAMGQGRLLGWAGAIHSYSHAWELHPLVVDPACQRRGIGTALVREVERAARENGILTLHLGSDDDFGGTNIFGEDLYRDIPGRIGALVPTAGHPLTFYRKMGFTVVGLLPDANGRGLHDIYLAKRIA